MNGVRETVLILDHGRSGQIRKAVPVFLLMKVRMRRILPEETGMTMGALAGLSEETGPADAPAGEELPPALIFCGFSGPRLDEALCRLRAAGVSREVYRAVLTETNAAWTVPELMWELREERKRFEE